LTRCEHACETCVCALVAEGGGARCTLLPTNLHCLNSSQLSAAMTHSQEVSSELETKLREEVAARERVERSLIASKQSFATGPRPLRDLVIPKKFLEIFLQIFSPDFSPDFSCVYFSGDFSLQIIFCSRFFRSIFFASGPVFPLNSFLRYLLLTLMSTSGHRAQVCVCSRSASPPPRCRR
jgi:hypothetical protein